MLSNSSIPSKALILIALLQGLALLALHQSIELEFWPYQSPQWLFTFYSIAFVAPIMLLLGLTAGSERVFLGWTGGFTAIVAALGYYVGSQAIPLPYIKYDFLLFSYVATLCVATFKALMYTQHFATGEPLSYSRLFRWSWRNFLTLALSLLFTLCVWGVLMLWAGLFRAIDILFFYDLFTEKWFYYPTLALANGFGVIIFRQQSNVIDTITRIQQALMKFLLVILVFVSLIFLATLPFTGLAPLWEKGGSMLILWMQLLMLFFLNAVYQDDPETQPYHLWIHRFLYLGIALLPVYSVISFYGLTLRVEQYGWTLSRCWAVLLWAILAMFSLGYLWGIVKQRDHWLNSLSWVNVRMGLGVLGLMLIVNSPLLDFRKISVASQLARLESGAVSLENFDYSYFRRELGRPGYEALMKIKEEVADSNPDIRIKINGFYADRRDKSIGSTEQEFIATIKVVNGDIPEGLGAEIYRQMGRNAWRVTQNIGYHLVAVDANEDGQSEYLLVEERSSYHQLTLFYHRGDAWYHTNIRSYQAVARGEALIEAINRGDIATKQPEWRDLEIGGHLFQIPWRADGVSVQVQSGN